MAWTDIGLSQRDARGPKNDTRSGGGPISRPDLDLDLLGQVPCGTLGPHKGEARTTARVKGG